jgi:tRNA A-37 threonylcarbamoyl transferase component Bud32
MNSEPSVPKCPQCGVAIPADAPQGLCPRCVLLGAATPTDAGKPVPRTEPPSPEALRAAFPHLEIVELIGRGGMGFVYKARQAKLDRLVALKLLPLELGVDPHFAERFHREARALARLNHPGIVAVYDFGVSAGFGYLLMEFVDGVNLRQAMQAGRFTQREALALVPKICEAIQFAHEQGVLHRDIKPENILLDTQGRVKIADFGIAKLVGEDAPDLTLTLSGARLGTPTYMAPEQVEHPGTVDHRADIYSLGVVFYELLTGELPLGRFAPPSAKADLDARVDDIVMRALAKDRELRQQSAGEVKTEVETVAASPRSPFAAAAPAAGPAPRTWSVKSWIGSWLLVIAGVVGVFLVFVAGRTVHDLGMGRSRTQPVELVVFLVVTGAALLCWRLGRRLHGQSEPAVPAEPIVPRPFLFADLALAWKPWLLLGLGLVGALLCGQAVVLLLPMVGAIAGLMRSGPLPFLLVLLAGCALVAGAWQCGLRRRELLHSLSLHVPETGLALDRWLSRAVVLLLAGLGGGMLIGFGSLFMALLSALGQEEPNEVVTVITVVAVIGAVAAWRRRGVSQVATPVTPTPAPAWMRRSAWWFFAVGGLALLPTLVSLGTPVRSFNLGSLLLLTGWALWSANGWVRRLALLSNWLGLFASVMAWAQSLAWLLRHDGFPGTGIGVPGVTTDPVAALVIGLWQLGAFIAGLVVLQRADVQAACGLTAPGVGVRRAGGVLMALILALGFWKAMRSASVSVVDDRGQPAVFPQIPVGGDRAWLQVNSPAQTRVQFTVNCWSNGVPRQLSEGAWSPGELIFATNVPFQQFITRAVRPGGDGQNWEVSDYEPAGIMGEQWTDSGIPLTVPLRAAVPHGTAVQLNPGDRLRRWLFLPEAEAQQVAAGGTGPANPTWGISLELELAADSPSAEAREAETVSRLELRLPQGQATALRTTVWNNGVPTPLPSAGMSLLPGLLSEPTVLHWRLRRLNSPGDWELVVTGAKDEKVLGSARVNLGTNVTALQPPAETRLSPTMGTFSRWWPFLPSFVKGNGVTSPDSTFGWGISVDVGPQDVMVGADAETPKP